MPDNKTAGWRQKIQGKPKDTPSLRLTFEDTAYLDDLKDKRRHGWRRTLHGSRPVTPVSAAPTTPFTHDFEDLQSETSENVTPRRNSKPKLIRYTSLFSSYKDGPKHNKAPDFSEPWSEDRPFLFEPYVDPLVAIQSIRAHMMNSSLKPIPLEHNNNLFCIFEDYGKLRHSNESLEKLLSEKTKEYLESAEQWSFDEQQYQAEICRLELLIASSESGVAGVIKARHGSIIDRKRRHRKTASVASSYVSQRMTMKELDIELKAKSRKILLHRPVSPSSRMAALSKRLSSKPYEDIHIGTPPHEKMEAGLSRRVQSELKLSNIISAAVANTTTPSVTSDFSTGDTGDLLPDEISPVSIAASLSSIEYEAFAALKELVTLIARRRGMDAQKFVDRIVALFNPSEKGDVLESLGPKASPNWSPSPADEDIDTPRAPLRRFQSQPHFGLPSKRRHFSFDPGEDELQALRQEATTATPEILIENRSRAQQHSHASEKVNVEAQSASPSPSRQMIVPDVGKYSKIPSPVQPLGRVRSVHKEGSMSSLHSVLTSPIDERRASRSSIMTAVANNSSGELRSSTTSGKTSPCTRTIGPSPSFRSHRGHTNMRTNVAAIAAARAAELMEKTTPIHAGGSDKGGTATVGGSRVCISRAQRTPGSENDRPQ